MEHYMCKTWDELEAEIKGCKKCKLCQNRTNY